MTSWAGEHFMRCYTLHGDGDIAAATAIQARLREQGVCSYFNWDPRPPHWRFFYETDLTQPEIENLLEAMLSRFKVTIER